MNCKQGEFARMVSSPWVPAARGLIVECIALAEPGHGYPMSLEPIWSCKAVSGAKSIQGFCHPGESCLIPDRWLRPLRDPDGEEGVLREAELPREVTA